MADIVIHNADLDTYERAYRANLVNSSTGFKPAILIGTRNAAGGTNLALFSSIVHLGADPALIGFIQRPVGKSGDTFRNILATRVYTMNHVHVSMIDRAHYTSARFEPGVSEFDACGFEAQYLEGFAAPFVRESRIKIGLELVQTMPIALNDTTLVIGKIVFLSLDAGCLQQNGNIDLNAANDVCVSGLETYHVPAWLKALPYAKMENMPVLF